MFQGEVYDWMAAPATASPSASCRVRRNASDWPGPRWTTDSMWWSCPVRAASMATVNGSVPRFRSDPTSDRRISSSPKLSDPPCQARPIGP